MLDSDEEVCRPVDVRQLLLLTFVQRWHDAHADHTPIYVTASDEESVSPSDDEIAAVVCYSPCG